MAQPMHGPHDFGHLRERLARGFLFGDAEHPWGTTGEDLVASCGHRLATSVARVILDATSAYGLDTVRHTAWAPAKGPVLDVSYDLASTTDLQSDGGIAAFRARVDAALGPGVHQPVDRLRPGGLCATSSWAAGPATVGMSAYTRPREHLAHPTSGLVSVAVPPTLLARPYLPEFWGIGAEWAHPRRDRGGPSPRTFADLRRLRPRPGSPRGQLRDVPARPSRNAGMGRGCARR